MEVKTCSKCKLEQPLENFWKRKTSKDSLDHHCINCHKKYGRKEVEEYPEKWRNRHYIRRYNITLEQYNKLLIFQKNSYAICNKYEIAVDGKTKLTKKLAVDHIKENNIIRGLLCQKCNMAIGCLNHDINLLNKAIEYLSNLKDISKIIQNEKVCTTDSDKGSN